MTFPESPLRELAKCLLAVEASRPSAAESQLDAAVRVCEKLRFSLTRFAGADGFSSLLRRALVLAQAEVPALQTVTIQADRRLEGLAEVAAQDSSLGVDAAISITAQLLSLLVTFVGEPITLRLVREAWPEAALNDFRFKN